MKTLAKVLAVAAVALTTSQAALARHHHDWQESQWQQNTSHYGMNYPQAYQPVPSNGFYNPGMYWDGQQWQGSYLDNHVGADGYPAWMGGYRPGRGR